MSNADITAGLGRPRFIPVEYDFNPGMEKFPALQRVALDHVVVTHKWLGRAKYGQHLYVPAPSARNATG
jgi:hypothetical protein